ncbi:AAA family ATPase [Hymenobacter sp. B81]|uniref:AAA family ATPase n=1 Tax=Hymenobacter sp. B81 TaxID=3344878 RepID=UPI0037DC52B7
MLEQQKQQIARALTSYLDEHKSEGMSQNKLAAMCGISPAYVSHILASNWNAVPVAGGKTSVISDQVWRKIQLALGLTSEVFETKNYLDVMYALAQAKGKAGYTIIDGDTGAGKTFAITEFQRQYPAATYVLKCSNAMTANEFVRTMAEVVGVGKTGSKMQVLAEVAAKLCREPNALLVIDEAETMVKKNLAIGFIKDLYDRVEGRAAIVITGANGLLEKLKVRASYNVESFPQVLRRFGAAPVLLSSGIDAGDAAEICAAFGITSKRDVSTLVAHCTNYGTLFSTLQKRKADQEALQAAA